MTRKTLGFVMSYHNVALGEEKRTIDVFSFMRTQI